MHHVQDREAPSLLLHQVQGSHPRQDDVSPEGALRVLELLEAWALCETVQVSTQVQEVPTSTTRCSMWRQIVTKLSWMATLKLALSLLMQQWDSRRVPCS